MLYPTHSNLVSKEKQVLVRFLSVTEIVPAAYYFNVMMIIYGFFDKKYFTFSKNQL